MFVILTVDNGKPIVHVAVPPEPVESPVAAAILIVGADVYPPPLPLIPIEAIDLPQNIAREA